MTLAKWRRVKQEYLNCNDKVLQEVSITKVNKVMYVVSCLLNLSRWEKGWEMSLVQFHASNFDWKKNQIINLAAAKLYKLNSFLRLPLKCFGILSLCYFFLFFLWPKFFCRNVCHQIGELYIFTTWINVIKLFLFPRSYSGKYGTLFSLVSIFSLVLSLRASKCLSVTVDKLHLTEWRRVFNSGSGCTRTTN